MRTRWKLSCHLTYGMESCHGALLPDRNAFMGQRSPNSCAVKYTLSMLRPGLVATRHVEPNTVAPAVEHQEKGIHHRVAVSNCPSAVRHPLFDQDKGRLEVFFALCDDALMLVLIQCERFWPPDLAYCNGVHCS